MSNDKVAEPLLETVGKITIPAVTANFVACKKFELKKDGGPCSYLGDNFNRWYLSGRGKIEGPIAKHVLYYARLRNPSVDGPIITELGGEAKVKIFLAEIFHLISLQPNGEVGVLLNNGWANICDVPDFTGALRAVRMCWSGGGWGIDAFSIDDPNIWHIGRQVFYHKRKLDS